MKALVQLILNATAAGKSMLLAANAAAQKVLLSLQNVDNTSDANKPVSTAQQTAIDAKIGGSVGATTNRLAKSSGTGGSTLQSTGITVDSSNNVSGVGTLDSSGQIRSLTSVRCMQINDNIDQRQIIFGGGFVQVDRDVYLTQVTYLSKTIVLAPITKAALLLLTPSVTAQGRYRVTDATPASRSAYPDGTNWRYTSDDTVVT